METPDRPAGRVGRPPPVSDEAPADAPPADPPRAARLRAIREQVAAGTYDSPGRLDAALDGLLADLLD